jgi:hypothetical protein
MPTGGCIHIFEVHYEPNVPTTAFSGKTFHSSVSELTFVLLVGFFFDVSIDRDLVKQEIEMLPIGLIFPMQENSGMVKIFLNLYRH